MSLNDFDRPPGIEIVINSIRGSVGGDDPSHHGKVVDESSKLTIAGRYMEITLERFLVNIQLPHILTEEVRTFSFLGAVWHNLWDYRLKILASDSVKMIDSEGFQHSGFGSKHHEFCKAILPGSKRVVDASFREPEWILEDHAKSRGWIWFDALPEGVVPNRFIFLFDVFEPGQTSGMVQNSETIEFVLTNYQQVPIRALPE